MTLIVQQGCYLGNWWLSCFGGVFLVVSVSFLFSACFGRSFSVWLVVLASARWFPSAVVRWLVASFRGFRWRSCVLLRFFSSCSRSLALLSLALVLRSCFLVGFVSCFLSCLRCSSCGRCSFRSFSWSRSPRLGSCLSALLGRGRRNQAALRRRWRRLRRRCCLI